MNKKRRKEIDRIKEVIENAKNDLEIARDEEEEAYDAMPESLKGSLRGDESYDTQVAMNDAISSLDEAIDNLNNIM